ncbi:hypothetical protein RNI52_29420 [Labrys neptuniae]|uniref:Uncharacterized protein n=1 Tax=Labrys neptuniae TaxID=376174 RepID=A0ABV3PSN8_9HYPH|nr:hypothetical protein [Labrys neptuniae]MDT3381482.1 hypothetical protein [Labrys neptuniae]
MGMHLTGPSSGQEPCLLFEDCGVLSAERLERGIPCLDFASPNCATSGIAALKAKLAVRKAMVRVHDRLKAIEAECNGRGPD